MAEWENRLGQESPLSRALRLAMPEDYRNPLLHPEAVNHFALPPQQPRAELRNPAPRPRDYLSPVSEALSPTMGAYGLGNALGDAYVKGREGDYKGMASPLAEVLLSMAPIPGMKKGARPASAIDRAVSIAQEVPQGERWEMRRSPQQRVIDEAKASGLWPEWGDAHPDRAVASAQEQMARREWDAVVNPIMYPYGSRAMSRDAAEAIAMQTHPELGLKYQDARRAWLEFDKQRELTPGEAMWEGLDRAPGVEPPSAAELMNVYGREKFMMVGHPELGRPKQRPQALSNVLMGDKDQQ